MKNDYEIRGDVTAIIINSPKYGRQEALISTCKLELAKEFPNSWFVRWDKGTKTFYVVGTRRNKTVLLHRWITKAPKGMVVDHFNHETLINTDANLKVLEYAENLQNQKSAYINSKSGVRGVFWVEKANRWQVQIRVNNVQKHIGYFKDFEAAKLASFEARKKYMPYSQEASGRSIS